MLWEPVQSVSTKLKRAPRLAGSHQKVGGFLYAGKDTPNKKQHQLGAAGWGLRRGIRLPAAQGTPYSTKRQGFLPGRTGLNPLDGIPLATRGLEETGRKPSSLRQGTWV